MKINLSSLPVAIFCAVAAAVLATSCGSSRTITASSGSRIERKGGSGKTSIQYTVIDGAMAASSRALLSEAKKWIGTPYRYGGEDRSGVDCSALVLNVYRDALNIKLPRSSGKQKEYSSTISKGDLIPGDLLFFATGGGSAVSHVGMYIGEGKMIHSSSSRGVMVSMIDEDYFVKTFAGAGRVDAYYAMVSRQQQKKEKTVEPKSQPKPEIVEPAAEPSFRFEPVASIPQRTTSVVAETPVVAQSTPQSSPDLTADDARRLVLNSLIEQKLDSIYASSVR